MSICFLRSFFNLIPRDTVSSVADVFYYCCGKQNGFLTHHTCKTVETRVKSSKLRFIHTARERNRDRYREGVQKQFLLIYCTEMFTLVRDRERNQDPFFPIVLVQFPVHVLVPFTYSVNKPLGNAFELDTVFSFLKLWWMKTILIRRSSLSLTIFWRKSHYSLDPLLFFASKVAPWRNFVYKPICCLSHLILSCLISVPSRRILPPGGS